MARDSRSTCFNTINVRVNQGTQRRVSGVSTFVGAIEAKQEIQQIYNVANNALLTAQTANDTANTKYDKTGGIIFGDVDITGNTTIEGTIIASSEIIDGGTFI
jgi:hypothetical protein